jgi:hypothetical protein
LEKILPNDSTAEMNRKKAILFQNISIPANEYTEIKYFVPEKTNNAFINIYDLMGSKMKTLEIKDIGQNKLRLNLDTFIFGNYIYTLFVDNIPIDIKMRATAK